MPTMEVPREEWPEFLEAFSRQHRAWLARVEQPGGAPGEPRPLAAVVPLGDRDHVTAIEIEFGDSHGPAVRIDTPAALRISKTDDGADRGLEIVNDRGVCTQVRFRAAAVPEMVDGVAPGER